MVTVTARRIRWAQRSWIGGLLPLQKHHTRLFLSCAVLIGSGATTACTGDPATPPPSQYVDTLAAPDTSLTTDLPLESAAERITEADMAAAISALAHDSMRGRGTPSPELDEAAAYIATGFRAAGLEPAGTDGYLHRWARDLRYLDTMAVAMALDSPSLALDWPTDYFLVRAHEQPTLEGDLYYAGSAANTTALDARDMEGKVVLFYNPAQTYGSEWLGYYFDAIQRAVQAEPVAVGFVLAETFGAEQVADLARDRVTSRSSLPLFGFSAHAVERLAAAVGQTPGALRNEARKSLHARLRVTMPSAGEIHFPANVVGVLRGSDPELSDTYVVLTAHFDHLGVGAPDATGDSIYNGADDNASGTAALLELADALSSLPEAPRRSILFLATSGEELGLKGSEAYLETTTVPSASMVAALNFDMVGRGPEGRLYLVGQDYTSLGALTREVDRHLPELELTLLPENPGQNLYARSDHWEFAKRRIPALFFFTGLHPDYHKPGDHADLVDLGKATAIARLGLWVTAVVADAEEAPEWTIEGERVMGFYWAHQ